MSKLEIPHSQIKRYFYYNEEWKMKEIFLLPFLIQHFAPAPQISSGGIDNLDFILSSEKLSSF